MEQMLNGHNNSLNNIIMNERILHNINNTHRNVYNNLAQEYSYREKIFSNEKRISNSMDYFIKNLNNTKLVLDLGCAVWWDSKILKEKWCNVTWLDLSNEMISYAKKDNENINFICWDFLNINFEENQFDWIHAQAFIHLFPEHITSEIFKKINLILKSNWIIKISTTNSNESKEWWEEKTDYTSQACRRYRKHYTELELTNILQKSWFKLMEKFNEKQTYWKIDKNWMIFIAKKII